LLWGFSKKTHGGGGEDPELFYLASADTKFLSPAVPGETLTLNVDAQGSFGPLYLYDVEALVGRRAVARGTLKLAMARG
jgi:3-hydroxymyristoyl/3-hydroxydecanoyl-(acyl carrier protein) dehydratase